MPVVGQDWAPIDTSDALALNQVRSAYPSNRLHGHHPGWPPCNPRRHSPRPESVNYCVPIPSPAGQLFHAYSQYESQLFATTHSEESLEALLAAANGNVSDIALWRMERGPQGPVLKQFGGETFKAGLEAGGCPPVSRST